MKIEDTLDAYIRFGKKYFIWHETKGWSVRHVVGKVKKKVNLKVFGVDFQDLKGGNPIMLGPNSQNWHLENGLGIRNGVQWKGQNYIYIYIIWKERRIPLMNMNLHGIFIGRQKMGDLNPSWSKSPNIFKTHFFVWDDNHKIHVWMSYINHVHNEDASWHIFIPILLDVHPIPNGTF